MTFELVHEFEQYHDYEPTSGNPEDDTIRRITIVSNNDAPWAYITYPDGKTERISVEHAGRLIAGVA